MNPVKSVRLCEVGPRDGFQYEAKRIPTTLKLELIRELAAAGLSRIQAVSFVHPDRVPQMADAEDVVAGLAGGGGTVYSGLALNLRGVRRAADCGLGHIDLSIATNERHGRDNAGMSVERGVEEAESMIEEANGRGLAVQLGLQTVFGYDAPGDTDLDIVVRLCARFAGMGVESLSLADTTGLANPVMIRERVRAVRAASGGVPLVLHLHDTRGLGLANVMAGWEEGVARFDTSLAGLGGCPFIPGAAGNVATEDVAYLFESMGASTGIDMPRVAGASRKLAAFLGRELAGKMYRLI
jgi:hydroxymethylglutaryl-CoA lyase